MSEPFWETAYREHRDRSAFGAPSAEVIALASSLAPGSRVLDLGCGDGRHAVPLAAQGLDVTAIDQSPAAIAALQHRAQRAGVRLSAAVQDLTEYEPPGAFDAVIAHGVLQLLAVPARDRVLTWMREHTTPGGYNVVAVFTDALPPPPDLAAVLCGLFREREVFERYADWEPVLVRSYVLEDEHPGGIRHRHPVNKLVARRPTAAPPAPTSVLRAGGITKRCR